MVKLLVGHMATTSVWQRFVMAQKWQTIIGQPDNATHVVVSETPANRHADWDTIVEQRGERHGLFNLSAMRNRLKEHAANNGYDWMMIVESDFIVLRWPTRQPSTWAIPNAIYDNRTEQAFQDIEDAHFSLFRNPRSWEILGHRPLIPVHCVILSNSVYDKAVWDERFEGCGYDDWDFNNMMHNTVGPFEFTDALLVHRYHQGTGAHPRVENQNIYENKWGKINKVLI